MTRIAQPRSTGYPGYTLTGARDPKTAGAARQLVRKAMADWELSSNAETVALIMSELVTNAVRYAQGPKIRMTVNRPELGTLQVAVLDWSPRRVPQLCTPAEDALQGRGLLLIDAIACRWGYDFMGTGLQPWGKRVWAELEVAP
ncbi:ATP-binding protein [Streptomyces griseorubiginosus]|uniref:ATP-binding protein n=1 Tax=Streptomyces griseorubiginosus TaxID=67304 RepID=UPI0036E91500